MRGLRPAAAAAGLSVALALAAPTASTRAAFSDTATVAGATTTAFTVPAPAQTCGNTSDGVALTFTPGSTPGSGSPALAYSATSSTGPNPSVPATGSPRVISLRSSDYRALLAANALFTVTVTATVPGTAWTRASTTTLRMTSVAGLLNYLSCT